MVLQAYTISYRTLDKPWHSTRLEEGEDFCLRNDVMTKALVTPRRKPQVTVETRWEAITLCRMWVPKGWTTFRYLQGRVTNYSFEFSVHSSSVNWALNLLNAEITLLLLLKKTRLLSVQIFCVLTEKKQQIGAFLFVLIKLRRLFYATWDYIFTPDNGDVAREHDAGVDVEEEDGCAKVAVEQVDGGVASVIVGHA